MKLVCVVLALLCAFVHADIYMHNPRGSNNRLNEQSATRNNNNRLFDSQNNNRGGYNVGDQTDQAFTTEEGQFSETYYEGSILHVTWTAQHGCGGGNNPNPRVRCEMIFQFLCDDDLRNGENTGTPNTQDSDQTTGRHESAEWYAECENRERNKGLYTADQNLNGDSAKHTRQNPNGGRSGLECPEERDYYPYFVPTPFTDAVVMSYDTERFEWYKQANAGKQRLEIRYEPSMWSRQNHLGNGLSGRQNSINYTIPTTEDLCGKSDQCKCIFRIRYNISTGDVDWFINSTFNGELSPLQQNPTVDIGIKQGLKLAINTAQTGRTFQDRSHIFYVVNRPNGAPSCTIHNVNVQGKRGNIVQTYPSVEYDFVPNILYANAGDCVQFQWAGSNTHNNGPNGGDGQTGDAGEGTGGTDRSNVVQIKSLGYNYPLYEDEVTMWNVQSTPSMTPGQLMRLFATLGVDDVDPLLNNAPASFMGPLLRYNNKGEYHYMCTRNNNFSNRSQKATLKIV
jgi:plastocyanin